MCKQVNGFFLDFKNTWVKTSKFFQNSHFLPEKLGMKNIWQLNNLRELTTRVSDEIRSTFGLRIGYYFRNLFKEGDKEESSVNYCFQWERKRI